MISFYLLQILILISNVLSELNYMNDYEVLFYTKNIPGENICAEAGYRAKKNTIKIFIISWIKQ